MPNQSSANLSKRKKKGDCSSTKQDINKDKSISGSNTDTICPSATITRGTRNTMSQKKGSIANTSNVLKETSVSKGSKSASKSTPNSAASKSPNLIF